MSDGLRIAAGFKAHSGWAVLVVISESAGDMKVIDRRRIELVEPDDIAWAKQPYHAAESLPIVEARQIVSRGINAAHRVAGREVRALVERSTRAGHDIGGCAVLVGTPMPEWTTDQILAVHMRMHKAEGVLFPAALIRAANTCRLMTVAIPEKELSAHVEESLGLASAMKRVARLGVSVGPPWGRDQKNAALAAMMVLQGHLPRR